jgi:hypothetical protein
MWSFKLFYKDRNGLFENRVKGFVAAYPCSSVPIVPPENKKNTNDWKST